VAPRQGPYGRNDGVTVWGYAGGGLIKYYAGAYDLYDGSTSPLFSGRLNLALLDPEPGYYSNSTYYGANVLSIAIGGQMKKDGSPTTDAAGAIVELDDYSLINADVLFEMPIGGGVLDIEGAFYKFNGDGEPTDFGWSGVASFLLPGEVAGTRLQPLVRVQQAKPTADGADTSTLIDAQFGVVLNAFATRFALGYRNAKAGDLKSQAIFLGAQFMK
jgi:hypothetical protein